MADWMPGQEILGEYLIERELGRGGMGVVWLVKSKSTERHFAVKQALPIGTDHRKAFLTELQAWIDLPAHPNLAPCRFFRTIGTEIAVFSDYIEGGSLADWIAKGRLKKLEQILDIAIQFAWGLHAIHEQGLIHQDIKPGNILMTADGVPMITDFGLARARMHSQNRSSTLVAQQSNQLSVATGSGFMTPAYASPEQRIGNPLSRRTDIWSWAVCILDIFVGGVSCPFGGHIAHEVLGALSEPDAELSHGLVITPGLLSVLRDCLSPDPESRISTALQIADRLIAEYRIAIGSEYPRAIPQSSSGPSVEASPALWSASRWTDPNIVLDAVLHATRKRGFLDLFRTPPPPQMEINTKRSPTSDLMQYEEAQRALEQAVSSGRKELQIYLADVYVQRSAIHRYLGDTEGSLTYADKAISMSQLAIRGFKKSEYYRQLLSAYGSKIGTLYEANRLDECLEPCRSLIALLKDLMSSHGSDYAFLSAQYYCDVATVSMKRGELKAAGSLCDVAIRILDLLPPVSIDQPAQDKDRLLAGLFNLQALICIKGRDSTSALHHLDRSILSLESIASKRRDPLLLSSLVSTYLNKANCLLNLHRYNDSMEECDKVVELAQQLDRHGNNPSIFNTVAGALAIKAASMSALEQYLAAVDLYDEAIRIRQYIVNTHGSEHLRESLYRLIYSRDIAITKAGNSIAANL